MISKKRGTRDSSKKMKNPKIFLEEKEKTKHTINISKINPILTSFLYFMLKKKK
jgi:hypothetical protein